MSKPRIAILGMHLESNSFAPVTTGADFRASCYLVEDEIVATVVRRSRCLTFQLAEMVVPRRLSAEILQLIDGLRPKQATI